MGRKIRCGNNQIGNFNNQYIGSTVFYNCNVTIQNCTECGQHQNQMVVEPKSKVEKELLPATQAQKNGIKKIMQMGSFLQKLFPRFGAAPLSDSVRIVDSSGQVVQPGDAIYSNSITYIYTGDGYAVCCQKNSRVERVELDLTRPVNKLTPLHGNVTLFPTELRVQRALQQVGWQCPANEGLPLDFVFWTFTGLSFTKCRQRGFDFNN